MNWNLDNDMVFKNKLKKQEHIEYCFMETVYFDKTFKIIFKFTKLIALLFEQETDG